MKRRDNYFLQNVQQETTKIFLLFSFPLFFSSTFHHNSVTIFGFQSFFCRSIESASLVLIRKMFVSKIYTKQPHRWNSLVKATMQFSTAAPTATTSSSSSGGSSFFQRLNSFLVGSSIGFGSCFYFIHEELKESNSKFENYLEKLEGRIKNLETKK